MKYRVAWVTVGIGVVRVLRGWVAWVTITIDDECPAWGVAWVATIAYRIVCLLRVGMLGREEDHSTRRFARRTVVDDTTWQAAHATLVAHNCRTGRHEVPDDLGVLEQVAKYLHDITVTGCSDRNRNVQTRINSDVSGFWPSFVRRLQGGGTPMNSSITGCCQSSTSSFAVVTPMPL